MIDKVKKLASSPIIGSDQDIENFVRIMELASGSVEVLKKSKSIIKSYYITGEVDNSKEHVIDNALSIIYNESKVPTKTTTATVKSKENQLLSNGAKDIFKTIQDENQTYFMSIAEIVDAYAEKKITNSDIKILSSKLKLNPLDIKTVYTYFYKDDKKIMDKFIVSKTLNDSNLTNLQKALIISKQYNSGEITEQEYHKYVKNSNIEYEDMDSIYNILYSVKYVAPTKEEILNISKSYEEEDLYVGSNIPTKKRINFKESCQYTIDEKILVLIDMTLFGSAKNAIAITVNGLYWNDDHIEEEKGIISWQELYSSNIEEYEEDTDTIKIGDYSINRLGSDLEREDIVKYLKALQNLKRVEESVAEVNSEPLKPDIDLKEAYKAPYKSMEELIIKAFLYSTPSNSIIRHFSQYNINSVEDDDYDIAREHILNLSDKNRLEEIIVESEKNFLIFFETAISSTREDIVKIVGKDIGQTFALNKQIVESLKQEIISYRSLFGSKMAELNNHSQQLKHYWSENEEGTGKLMTDVLKGGSLGMIGATLLGPVGIAVAVGANYLSDKESEKKKDNLYETLYNNWATAHDSFYFTQLKEYDEKYKLLIANISKQFIDNYKQAYKISIEMNKKAEFLNYFKSELKDMITEDSFIEMRKEIKEHKEMFS